MLYAKFLHLLAKLQGGKAADLLPTLYGNHTVFGVHTGHNAVRSKGFYQLLHKFRPLYGSGTDDAAGDAEVQHIFYRLCAADTAAQFNRNGNAGCNGPDGILVHGMSGQRSVQIHNVEKRRPLADPELCHVSRSIGVYFYVIK